MIGVRLEEPLICAWKAVLTLVFIRFWVKYEQSTTHLTVLCSLPSPWTHSTANRGWFSPVLITICIAALAARWRFL